MKLEGVRHVFVDFDSTLVAVEGLEVLASIVAGRRPRDEGRALRAEVEELTSRAMAGEVSFEEALATRLRLLRPRRDDLDRAKAVIGAALEPTARETVAALGKAGLEVHVISGGISDLVVPACLDAGIPASRVHCNELRFDGDEASSVEPGNPLAHDHGKSVVVRGLAARDEAAVVGDGATDLEVREDGAARWFVAHVGIRERPAVAARADHVIRRLSELVPLLT